MQGQERRTAKRYVIDGLSAELDGVVHDTIDISPCAVALVACPDVAYEEFKGRLRLVSPAHRELNQSLTDIHFITRRGAVAVFGYKVKASQWEMKLARYDVRADMVQLEDVFG
jgi:hypothetical protein